MKRDRVQLLRSRAAVFLAGVLLGALVSGLIVGWLVSDRNERQAQFAARDALLPEAMSQTILRRLPNLDPERVSGAVRGALAMAPASGMLGDPHVMFLTSQNSLFALQVVERSEARVVVLLSSGPNPPAGLGGRSYTLTMTRDPTGAWSGTISQPAVS